MLKTFKVSTEIYKNPSRVWDVLTTTKGMGHWFSETAAHDAKPGGTMRFRGNFVFGWREGMEFESKLTAYEPEQKFGFEFPLYLRDGRVLTGDVLFELEPLGGHTKLTLTHHIETPANDPPYYLNDLWGYYLNVLTNTCEHDYSEPGLLFDFTRPWKGNIKHVIYVNANPEEIFRALHDPQWLAKYFTDAKVFEGQAEGRIDFGWSDAGPRRVIEWDPPIELSYDWALPIDGDTHLGRITWQLEPEGRQTRVTMKQSAFDANVDHFRTGEALGWAAILLDLKRVIESGRPALNQAGAYVE